jgi:hypothetical protein
VNLLGVMAICLGRVLETLGVEVALHGLTADPYRHVTIDGHSPWSSAWWKASAMRIPLSVLRVCAYRAVTDVAFQPFTPSCRSCAKAEATRLLLPRTLAIDG